MVMIFTLLPMSAFAADVVAEGTCGENLTWTLDSEGTLTISGTGAMTDYSYDPNAPWFNSRSSIKSVIIENGVTSIGNYAFYFCSNLASVTIPNSVTSIGDQAFYSCNKLANVTIPDSVTSIGDSAFFLCSNLVSVTIPNSVTIIGNDAFISCRSLTGIWVDDANVKYSSDEHGVLFNKNKTKLICCPGGYDEPYVIPGSVTIIGNYAFYFCSNLASVTIPDSVTSIGNDAFCGCSSLTSVTIPDSVTSIGNYAFRSCTSLTSVTIPDSVTSIGDIVFTDCSSLTGIWVDDANVKYSSDEHGVLFNKDKTKLICCPGGYDGSYAIPGSVTSIDAWAFYGCSSLISVTIPDNVTSIGNYAFYDCSSLISVTIPNSVTSIGSWSFSYCDSLISVTIPDSVTSIGRYAFYDCSSLTSVTISSSVKNIGDCAFKNCSGLTDIYYAGTEEQRNIISIGSDNSYLADATWHYQHIHNYIQNTVHTATCTEAGYIDHICEHGETYREYTSPALGHNYENGVCTNCKKINAIATGTCGTNVTWVLDNEGVLTISGSGNMKDYGWISGSLTNIYSAPWDTYSEYIKSVIITEGVMSIGFAAFNSLSNLKSVTISDSVKSVGSYSFEKCSGLTSITIPEGVTWIGNYAFSNCTALTSVTIPDSLTNIYHSAFSNCSSLTDVYYAGTEEQRGEITIDSWNSSLTNATWHYNHTHNYIKHTVVSEATCTEAGYIDHSCIYGETYREYVPALGHELVDGIVTAPTCTERGYTTYTCSRCGDQIITAYTAPEHKNNDGVITAPTCTEQGFTTYTCTVCGESYKDDYTVALGHEPVEIPAKAATCTEDGNEIGSRCERCGQILIEPTVIPATGHSKQILQEAIAPTCTEVGYTEESKCSVCNEMIKERTEVPALGHDYSDATCTAPKTCKTCGATDGEAIGHDLVHHDGKAATCIEAGHDAYYNCSNCNKLFADVNGENEISFPATEALGHDLVHHDGKAATCTEKGREAYDTCSRCDYTTYKEISALGHSFGKWTVTTAPTCTEKGIETCYCNHCPETETRDVDALGHDYKDGVCTRCGAKDPDYTPPVKENPFVDVSESSVYYDAILWAYYHEPQQITGGYTATEFRPGNPCTRGQVVTFLWRAAGCPEPTGDTSMFNDASSIAAPYQKAVAWAVEKGITTGYNDGTFRPNDSVTRAQFVTFLWRYEGKPATSGSIAGFTDAASIAAPYQQAVAWAVEKGITTGYNDGSFRPNSTCTRWAVVLFMYRDMN